jgi:hypothetical protein
MTQAMLSRFAIAIQRGAWTVWPARAAAVAIVKPVVLPHGQTLRAEDQWSRIANCLAVSVERTAGIRDCQMAASAQLDAASYALQTLKAELATLTPVAASQIAATGALAVTRANSDFETFRRRKSIAA